VDISVSRSNYSQRACGNDVFAKLRPGWTGNVNVNKLNTKATLRCSLEETWIPVWARQELIKSPYYVSSSNSIQITSTVYRSQSQNIDDCLSKLHSLILAASSASVKNEPSEMQKMRVAAFERADKAKRRREKAHHSAIKRGRGAKGGNGWD